MNVPQVIDEIAPIAETFWALVATVYPILFIWFDGFLYSMCLGPMSCPPGLMGKTLAAIVTFVFLREGFLRRSSFGFR